MRATVLVGLALVMATSGACARVKELTKTTPDKVDRPASDGPGQFQTADGTLNNNAACLTPLVDPRDKTSIALVRSRHGYGDYKVPAGKYGVGAAELLRVDCTVGRAVGVVREE